MTKADLIAVVAEKTGSSKKDSEKMLTAVIDSITEALAAGEKIQIVNFGTFEVKTRAARTGRNPKTGEAMQIAASKTPAFTAGKGLKDAVK